MTARRRSPSPTAGADAPGSNRVKDPSRWRSGDDPMTGAQASYLETLSEEAHADAPPQDLTKGEASQRIEVLREELGLEGRR